MSKTEENKTDKKIDQTAESPASDKEKGKKAKKAKPKKSLKARLLVWGIIVVLLIALIFAVRGCRPGGGKGYDAYKTPSHLQGKTKTILVCGLDNSDDRDIEAWMTDVIMMVNMDFENDSASVLQIPRDTYVGQDLVKYGKINGLYYYGYKDKDNSGGIECLIETIYNQMKLPVDNYVLITMDGFMKAVDKLGGIEVTLDQDMQFENFALPAGTHLLTGEQAMEFVRYRAGYENADLDRLNTQRYFLMALLDRLLESSTMELASMAAAIYDYLITDLTVAELLELADEAKQLTRESIQIVRVPGEPVTRYGLYGVDIYSVHTEALADVLNTYMRPYTDDVPPTDLNVIEVQNTTDEFDDPGGTLGEDAGPLLDGQTDDTTI